MSLNKQQQHHQISSLKTHSLCWVSAQGRHSTHINDFGEHVALTVIAFTVILETEMTAADVFCGASWYSSASIYYLSLFGSLSLFFCVLMSALSWIQRACSWFWKAPDC